MYNDKKKKIKIEPQMIPAKYTNLLEIKMNTLVLKIDVTVLGDNGEPILFVRRFNTVDNNVELII